MLFGQSDLALDVDPARRYLHWLMAMIVYLAGLALAGMLSLSSAVDRWDQGLSGSVTVQVPPLADGNAKKEESRVAKAIEVLRSTPGIASVRALEIDETMALLEPWLGPGGLVAQDLPLPRLIDVRLRTEAQPNMEGLASVLENTVPGAVIDDHKKALDKLTALARSVELVALAIVALVALGAVGTVIFITRTGLAIHRSAIELLHIMGAVDSYIARQFEGQALELGLKGGIVGMVLTACTVLILGRFASALTVGLMPDFSFTITQWAGLMAVPIVVLVIALVTARFTVIQEIKRLP
jgi:cell division transport system permease protein